MLPAKLMRDRITSLLDARLAYWVRYCIAL
jgi:hypothetical protein